MSHDEDANFKESALQDAKLWKITAEEALTPALSMRFLRFAADSFTAAGEYREALECFLDLHEMENDTFYGFSDILEFKYLDRSDPESASVLTKLKNLMIDVKEIVSKERSSKIRDLEKHIYNL